MNTVILFKLSNTELVFIFNYAIEASMMSAATRSKYVSVTDRTFPTKYQAVIVEVDIGATCTDTVIAIAEIISGENIIFTSTLSHNRICIYLKNTMFANRVTSEHTKIKY